MNLTDIFQMTSISLPKGVAGPLPAMSGYLKMNGEKYDVLADCL